MDEIFSSLGVSSDYITIGEGALPSNYAVTDLAVAAYGAVGVAIAELLAAQGLAKAPKVQVDRVLASRWYGSSIHPIGWELPPLWDAVAGLYHCKNGCTPICPIIAAPHFQCSMPRPPVKRWRGPR